MFEFPLTNCVYVNPKILFSSETIKMGFEDVKIDLIDIVSASNSNSILEVVKVRCKIHIHPN